MMKTEQEIREEIKNSKLFLDYWKDNLERDKVYERNQIPNDEKAITIWENYIAALEWVLESEDKE